MQGTLEKSRKILNTMKILLVIIPILCYKFKESWKIPEKNAINGGFFGYNTYLRL